jgi:predicted nucleic acid-binding protein
VSDASDGLLDTNVFLHAQTTDRFGEECRRFLTSLEDGERSASLEPLVLHELSYVLPIVVKQMGRRDVADYLLTVLSWPGVRGEKDLMADTVQRWRDAPNLSFVDAFLASLAARRHCPVYTKNVRDLTGQGALVPDPLPSGPPA